MSHWDSCNAIERRPDKVSGAWIFENTRLPVATLFEALKNSPAIDQFLDDFEGVTRQQVVAVLDHEINSLEQHFEQDILKEAARIIKTELPKHLSADFAINDVEAESRPGPDCEDYIHVNVILEDDHPELDARKLLRFKQTLLPMFERAGIVPSPTISYSNRGELAR